MAGRVGPVVLAVAAAFVVSRVVARPANPGALLWWLGIAATGMAALRLLFGLMLRARALAALLRVTATFPSRPPRRAAIAWAMPDTVRLRRGLDELSKGAWTTESQSRRAALVTALWALDESIRHPGLLWRASDRDAGARLAEGDVPGLLQVIPRPSIHHRTVTAGISLAALALLLSSVVLTSVQPDRSSQFAKRGPAGVPVSPRSGGPVGEPLPATEAPESSASTTPAVGSLSAPSSHELPATEPASRPALEASSSQSQSQSQPEAEAEAPAARQSVSPALSPVPSGTPAVQETLQPAAPDSRLVAIATAGPLTAAVSEVAPLPATVGALQLRAVTVPASDQVATAQAETGPGGASSAAEPSPVARVAPTGMEPRTALSSTTSVGDVTGAAPRATVTTTGDQPPGGDEQPPTADGSAEPRIDTIATAASPAAAARMPITAPAELVAEPIAPSPPLSPADPTTNLGG